MPQALRITDWEARYEVNKDGGCWIEGKDLRVKPLDYWRCPVWGWVHGEGWQELCEAAGSEMLAATFGIFVKLCEVAGNRKGGERGWILKDDRPVGAELIARKLKFSVRQVNDALYILIYKVKWLEVTECEFAAEPEEPVSFCVNMLEDGQDRQVSEFSEFSASRRIASEPNPNTKRSEDKYKPKAAGDGADCGSRTARTGSAGGQGRDLEGGGEVENCGSRMVEGGEGVSGAEPDSDREGEKLEGSDGVEVLELESSGGLIGDFSEESVFGGSDDSVDREISGLDSSADSGRSRAGKITDQRARGPVCGQGRQEGAVSTARGALSWEVYIGELDVLTEYPGVILEDLSDNPGAAWLQFEDRALIWARQLAPSMAPRETADESIKEQARADVTTVSRFLRQGWDLSAEYEIERGYVAIELLRLMQTKMQEVRRSRGRLRKPMAIWTAAAKKELAEHEEKLGRGTHMMQKQKPP